MTAKQRYRDNARNEAQTRFATITGIVQTDEGRWVSVPDIFQVGFINNHVVLIGEGLHQIISMKGSSTWRTMVDRLKGWTNTNPFHAIDNLALHAVWKPRIFVPEMAFEAADGIEDHFTDGEHLVLVEPENWDAMHEAIDRWLIDPRGRARIAQAGRAHVLTHHTYERRMTDLIAHLKGNDMLPDHLTRSGRTTVTRQGVTGVFDLRPDSTDAIVVAETWGENVYGINAADVAGKTVLDIGANVGAFTIWAIAAGAERVIAVEPSTENLEALRANLALNGGHERVTILEVAVSDKAGKAEFIYNDEAPGGSTLTPKGYDSSKNTTSTVQTVTLATVIKELGGHVDVCKVDIEGGEYAALTGASAGEALDCIDRIVGEWHHIEDAKIAGAFFLNLLEHGRLDIFGRPEHGGQFAWRRYGA